MIVVDVNVLVAAHREDNPHHADVAQWVRGLALDEVLAVPAPALLGFLRMVTHPGIFPEPTPLAIALAFADSIRGHPAYLELVPGPEHWQILRRLALEHGLAGNDLADAHLAALAIENSAPLATFDRGFARFDELTTVTPR